MGTTRLRVGEPTIVRFDQPLQRVWRFHSWPTALPRLGFRALRESSAVATDDLLVLADSFSPHGMSLTAIRNPTKPDARTGEVDVHWWVHGFPVGMPSSVDRRVLSQAIGDLMNGDFGSAQMFATIAAEAALNRFRDALPNTQRRQSSIAPKVQAALRWCEKYQNEDTATLKELNPRIVTDLKEPRDLYGHGEVATVEARDAVSAIATSVRLLLWVEAAILHWRHANESPGR